MLLIIHSRHPKTIRAVFYSGKLSLNLFTGAFSLEVSGVFCVLSAALVILLDEPASRVSIFFNLCHYFGSIVSISEVVAEHEFKPHFLCFQYGWS